MQEAYQPIGDLVLNFEAGNVTDYRRELDMETGVAKVSYRVGDAVITRQAFVLWPDRVLVVASAATSRGAYRWGVQFKGPYLETSCRQRPAGDGRDVERPVSAATGGQPEIARTEGKGLRYEAARRRGWKGGNRRRPARR